MEKICCGTHNLEGSQTFATTSEVDTNEMDKMYCNIQINAAPNFISSAQRNGTEEISVEHISSPQSIVISSNDMTNTCYVEDIPQFSSLTVFDSPERVNKDDNTNEPVINSDGKLCRTPKRKREEVDSCDDIAVIPQKMCTNEVGANSTCSTKEKLLYEKRVLKQQEKEKLFKQNVKAYWIGTYRKYYHILGWVGSGAYGDAMLTAENGSGRLGITKFICKKKMKIHNLHKTGLPQEVVMLRKLTHPNIVGMLTYFQTETNHQIVFEKNGISIDLYFFNTRRKTRIIDENICVYILQEIVSGLEYMYEKNIAHRDIKDENVIINDHFQVKIIDFGAAWEMNTDGIIIPTKKFAGTKDYGSPQVLTERTYNVLAEDIWALGFMLYTTVFFELPFDKKNQITDKLVIPDICSPELRSLLLATLEPKSSRRCNLTDVRNSAWLQQEINIANFNFYDYVARDKLPAYSKSRTPSEFKKFEAEENLKKLFRKTKSSNKTSTNTSTEVSINRSSTLPSYHSGNSSISIFSSDSSSSADSICSLYMKLYGRNCSWLDPFEKSPQEPMEPFTYADFIYSDRLVRTV